MYAANKRYPHTSCTIFVDEIVLNIVSVYTGDMQITDKIAIVNLLFYL